MLSSVLVDERLHLNGTAAAQALREIPRNHNTHLGVAVVERPRERRIIVDHPRTIWKYSLD